MGRTAAHEHRDYGGTERRAYDDLRSLGIGHAAAKVGAADAARGTHENLERLFGGRLAARGQALEEHRKSRFRVRFPWEPPEAGISLPSRGER